MSLSNDSVLIAVFVFVAAIAAVPVLMVMSEFNTAIQDSDLNTEGKDNIASTASALPRVFDWMFALFAVGLPLVTMGLAYTTRVPSAFFWLSIGFLLLLVFVASGLQEGYESLAADAGTASTISTIPITNWVMTNLLSYSIFVFFMIAWGTYIKFGRNSGGGYY